MSGRVNIKMAIEDMPRTAATPEDELELIVNGELPKTVGSMAMENHPELFFENVLEPMPFGD